jgi:hypothetical protein
MADVQNVVTLGIGSAPGSIRYFVLVGLDANPTTFAPLALTPEARSTGLTPDTRSTGLTPDTRGVALTPEERP